MLRGDAGYTLVLIDEGKLMDDSKRYFLRSWRMLTCRRGWVKPILVLSVAWLVPIAGPLALLGYALEWARLSAWGVDSSPKQSKVQVGAASCLGGARSSSPFAGRSSGAVSWVCSGLR